MKNRQGAAVRASPGSVTAATDAALADLPDDLRYSLTDVPGPDSYPISGTVWAIVFVKHRPARGGPWSASFAGRPTRARAKPPSGTTPACPRASSSASTRS